MRTDDLKEVEKFYPYVDDEGRHYRLIGGGAAAGRDYYTPGASLVDRVSDFVFISIERASAALASAPPPTLNRETLLIQLKELLWLETLIHLGALMPKVSAPTCFILETAVEGVARRATALNLGIIFKNFFESSVSDPGTTLLRSA